MEMAMNKPRGSLHAPVVRFSHSIAFIGFLRKLGAPTDRYLGMSKLPRLCEEPDYLIPVSKMYAFLETAARKEQPSLGWLIGERAGNLQLSSALRKRLQAASTLLTALQSLVQLVKSEASDLDVGIIQRKDDIVLFTHYVGMRSVPGYAVAQAYQLSVFIAVVQTFLGKNWLPPEIGLECQHAPHELPERFRAGRYFPGSPFGYFTVQKSCLHHSLPGAPAGSAAKSALRGIDQFDDLELVRGVLRSYLAEGYLSQAFAAELLDTPVRSLTRRLAEHGTTYQELIDGLRFRVAKEHLDNPDTLVLDVANAVGFKDKADFTRMFRRVSGLTPTGYRRVACPS